MKVSGAINRFLSIFKNSDRYISGEDATARIIRRLASPCPACGQLDLNGHKYAEIATQKAPGNTEALRHFFELYVSRKWSELNQIHEFDGSINDVAVYALFCARGGCMLAIRLPVELYEPESLEGVIVFDEPETAAIRSLPINLLAVSRAEQNLGREMN